MKWLVQLFFKFDDEEYAEVSKIRKEAVLRYRRHPMSLSERTQAVYLDLENPQDLQKVSDIATFHKMNSDKLIILDEVQRLPEIFQQIRGIIDQERYRGNKTGIFLFLGSASIDLLKQSGESLAGRIAYHDRFHYLESRAARQVVSRESG